VWEHAYYLDHQNDREGWANTFLDHLVDWDYVGTRL
jgi:Fe-Mn family superoxide dismutase